MLIVTADTKANGLFTITDELIEENIEVARAGRASTSRPTSSSTSP